MSNLAIELNLLGMFLINFIAIITANICSKSIEEYKINSFAENFFSNFYCIT